jgi:hypothetical protein
LVVEHLPDVASVYVVGRRIRGYGGQHLLDAWGVFDIVRTGCPLVRGYRIGGLQSLRRRVDQVVQRGGVISARRLRRCCGRCAGGC